MKLIIAAALCFAAAGAQAANRCTTPDGKVTYSDAPCPAEAQSRAVRTDANSLDTSHSRRLGRQLEAAQECDAARETLRHSSTKANRAAVRQACREAVAEPAQAAGSAPQPAPTPRRRTRTTCTTQSQAIGGGLSVGTGNCVTR